MLICNVTMFSKVFNKWKNQGPYRVNETASFGKITLNRKLKMKTLICDICGGNLSMDVSGDFAICETCGMKHTKDRINAKVQKDIECATEQTRIAISYVPEIIPEKFTDEFIKSEITRLSSYIMDCARCLNAPEMEILNANEKETQLETERRVRSQELAAKLIVGRDGKMGDHRYRTISDQLIQLAHARSEAQETVARYKSQISDSESKRRELKALVQLSPAERMEKCYQSLIEKKCTADDLNIFGKLIDGFRDLGDYKDAKAQVEECSNLSIEWTYDKLVKAKNEASTKEEFHDLAHEFLVMNGYKNTAELAIECNNLAKEAQYDLLIKAKNKASTKEEYQDIAQEFREMNSYKNTTELAIECDNLAKEVQYDLLVEAKNKASTKKEYKNLSQRFRNMNCYKNTDELASECDGQCYDLLLKQKNKVSTEEEYKDLAQWFREMNGYKNTAELAIECDNLAKKAHEYKTSAMEDSIRWEMDEDKRRKRKQLFEVIFWNGLSGVLGGSFFAILASTMDDGQATLNSSFLFIFLIVGISILLAWLDGWMNFGKSCGIGCGLSFVILVIFMIGVMYFPLAICIVSGIIVGVLIYNLIKLEMKSKWGGR